MLSELLLMKNVMVRNMLNGLGGLMISIIIGLEELMDIKIQMIQEY